MLINKKAVIFDLDGTLIDSMWVWEAVDQEFYIKHDLVGATIPEDIHEQMEGMSFTEVANFFRELFDISASVEEIKQDWLKSTYDKYVNEVFLKEGCLELLTHLSNNQIKMGIATSNSRELVEAVLKARGIEHYFEYICTSCEVNAGKPAPDVYLNVAKRLEIDPEHCLVFEDVVKGIQGGKNAGMTVCAVKDAFSEGQLERKKEIADYYVETFHDVISGLYEEKK